MPVASLQETNGSKAFQAEGVLVIFEDPVFFQSFKHLGCCMASFRVSFRSSLRGLPRAECKVGEHCLMSSLQEPGLHGNWGLMQESVDLN